MSNDGPDPLPEPGKPGKQRLDQLLVDRGLVESRTRAQALILAGRVYSGEKRMDKAGASLPADTPLTLRGQDHPWVSRGGLKLAKALELFDVRPEGRIALDVGASTGGFTDVLLAHGAAKVFAVDVGRGQMHWRLQTDPRVIRLDGVNARYLSREQIPDPVSLIVCDASFIGLETVLPTPLSLAAPAAQLVALIKPQFEVGRERVGKGGVVRDPALHEETCLRIEAWLRRLGWRILGRAPSPITGAEGNIEFLVAAELSTTKSAP